MRGKFKALETKAELCLDKVCTLGYDNWGEDGPVNNLVRGNIYAQGVCEQYTAEFEDIEPNCVKQKKSLAGGLQHFFPTTQDGIIVDATYLQFSDAYKKFWAPPNVITIPNGAPQILIANTLEDVERILKRAQIPDQFWVFWLDQLAD